MYCLSRHTNLSFCAETHVSTRLDIKNYQITTHSVIAVSISTIPQTSIHRESNRQPHAYHQMTQSTEPRTSTQHQRCDLFLLKVGSFSLGTPNLNIPSQTSRFPFYWSTKNARQNNPEISSKESFHHLEYRRTISFLLTF